MNKRECSFLQNFKKRTSISICNWFDWHNNQNVRKHLSFSLFIFLSVCHFHRRGKSEHMSAWFPRRHCIMPALGLCQPPTHGVHLPPASQLRHSESLTQLLIPTLSPILFMGNLWQANRIIKNERNVLRTATVSH